MGAVMMCAWWCAAASAEPARNSIGGLTYVLPPGWKAEPPVADHVRLTFADTKRYCIISLYQPRSAGADLDAEFLTEWKSVAGTAKDRSPTLGRRTLGGHELVEATGAIKGDDGTSLFERVVIVAGEGQLTTIVVLAATRATEQACAADSTGIATSVSFAATASQPPAPAVRNGLAGTLHTTFTLADLAGEWTSGAGLVLYNHSGTTTTTSAAVAGMRYTFAANGTFKYSEAGRNGNHSFHENSEGTIAINAGVVTLTTKDRVRTFQSLAFMTTQEGAAVLTWREYGSLGRTWTADEIRDMCGPRNGVYECQYSDLWSRAAPKH